MKLETWYCGNAKRLTLGFLVLQYHKISEFLLFQLAVLETSFLILGFLKTHQTFNQKLS